MSEPHVKPGYKQARDDRDLTARDRQVLMLLHEGQNQAQAAASMGLTRQRVSAIVQKLKERGYVTKGGRKVIVNVRKLIES